jgi:hypothetical protein
MKARQCSSDTSPVRTIFRESVYFPMCSRSLISSYQSLPVAAACDVFRPTRSKLPARVARRSPCCSRCSKRFPIRASSSESRRSKRARARQAADRIAPVRLEFRQPQRDGTTDVVFDPVEFLGRLAVLVPRPRINLILYHGVLGRRAAWRSDVVRRTPSGEGPDAGLARSHHREVRASMSVSPRNVRNACLACETRPPASTTSWNARVAPSSHRHVSSKALI